MKFNAVVGNPPYQVSDGGGTGDSAKPIYNLFVEAAKLLNPQFVSMIMPSRWLKKGKGLDSFRADMMSDTRIRTIHDFADEHECFPGGVHIDGGIMFFLWDKHYDGKVKYLFKPANGELEISERFLKTDLSSTVVRDARQITILEKIAKHKKTSFSQLVSIRNNYGFATDLFNRPQNYPDAHLCVEKQNKNFVKIYGVKGNKGGAKRVIGYVDKNSIKKDLSSVNLYKLFFSYAYSTGATVPPEIIVGKPGEIATETFLRIGPFDRELYCKNCLNYMKSKFFRALLFFNRISKNSSQTTFELIPVQDFTDKSDIDWSKSIAEIDKQLYKKYGLDKKEIDFIESMIKPME